MTLSLIEFYFLTKEHSKKNDAEENTQNKKTLGQSCCHTSNSVEHVEFLCMWKRQGKQHEFGYQLKLSYLKFFEYFSTGNKSPSTPLFIQKVRTNVFCREWASKRASEKWVQERAIKRTNQRAPAWIRKEKKVHIIKYSKFKTASLYIYTYAYLGHISSSVEKSTVSK